MSTACISCLNPKANLVCRQCGSNVCKSCVEFVDDEDFSYLDLIEVESPTGSYCTGCYSTVMTPRLEAYQELLEKAKEVAVFSSDKGKESRNIKRSDLKIKIDTCADEKDLIMRLAFKAAQAGYNTIVDMDLVYTKVRDGSFKISNWAGTATAANVFERMPQTHSSRRSPSR